MIQNDKAPKAKLADLIAFEVFIQNICIGQKNCSPKCPLRDPYCKCKIVARPSWLSSLNSYMYSKVAAAYRLFGRLKNMCMLSACSNCRLYVKVNIDDDRSYNDCLYYSFVIKLKRIINHNIINWRYMR